MFGFKLASQTLVFAFALPVLLLVSSFAQACMGCEMLKYPAIVLTFSPDGKLLASSNFCRRDGQRWQFRTTIELWQVPKKELVRQLQEGQRVVALAFSPDGKFLAAGGFGNWVSLWKMPEGRRIGKLAVKVHQVKINWVRSLAFSPDGRLLAAGTGTATPEKGKIYIWQIPQGKLIATLSAKDYVVVSIAFSPDGKKLAAVLAESDRFQLWDVRTKKLLWECKHGYGYFSVAFTKDGRKLVGAGYRLIVLSTSDGREIAKIDPSPFYSPPGGISADGKFVALCDYSGSVRVVKSNDFKDTWRGGIVSWKLRRRVLIWAEAIERKLGLPATRLFPNTRFPFAFGFAFSRDNRWLALGFDDGQIKLWRIR